MDKNTKYVRLYGKTLQQLAASMGKSGSEISYMHRNGLLNKRKDALPEKLDGRLLVVVRNAMNRCKTESPRNTRYYISKGIKFLMTWKECQELWERDGASSMKRPSLCRDDHSKSYTKKNCSFQEWSDHHQDDIYNRTVGKRLKEMRDKKRRK